MLVHAPSMLITDDDRDFRETLQNLFETRGFHTVLAADGQEALEIVHHQSIQLVLLDMHMPRLTGLETIIRVKQTHARIPCILLSGNLTDQIERAARAANVYSVLSKPVRFAQITGIVDQAMRTTYGAEYGG